MRWWQLFLKGCDAFNESRQVYRHVTEQKVRGQREDMSGSNEPQRTNDSSQVESDVSPNPVEWITVQVSAFTRPTVWIDAVERRGGDDGDFALTKRTLARVQVHAGSMHLDRGTEKNSTQLSVLLPLEQCSSVLPATDGCISAAARWSAISWNQMC